MAQQGNAVIPMGLCLENYDYSYPVNYVTLNIQRQVLKMAFMDVRPEQPNGQTVVLFHGKNFCGAYWGQTAKALAGKGYRVIVPDQIGFGKSSKPDMLQYTFQLLAAATRAVLDSVGVGKVILLGHSMGGMVATRFALLFPERIGKFILENPIGLEDWQLKVPYQGVDAWFEQEIKQNYDSLRKYEEESYYHGTWSNDYDRWLNIYAGWTLSPDYSRIAWNSALTYDMIFNQPVCYEFGLVKAPSLLIVGQLDRTALGKNLVPESVAKTMGDYPELGKATAAKIPNCQLVALAGVGHVPHVEAFERFIGTLLDFLSSAA